MRDCLDAQMNGIAEKNWYSAPANCDHRSSALLLCSSGNDPTLDRGSRGGSSVRAQSNRAAGRASEGRCQRSPNAVSHMRGDPAVPADAVSDNRLASA